MPTPENVAADGVASPVAVDNISGVVFQRVKLALGPDGTYTADADGDGTLGMKVQVTQIASETLTALGYQQISAATLAAATALTVPGGTHTAFIQCETLDVRWRDDGTNPTASIGMILQAGQTLVYSVTAFPIKFIRTGGTSILNVTYYS